MDNLEIQKKNFYKHLWALIITIIILIVSFYTVPFVAIIIILFIPWLVVNDLGNTYKKGEISKVSHWVFSLIWMSPIIALLLFFGACFVNIGF